MNNQNFNRNDRHDDLSLDILGRIDEDILERNLEKRFRLSRRMTGKMPRQKKMRMFIGGGIAAAILLGVLAFVLVMIFGKQVPIYRGMSVSHIDGGAQVSALGKHMLLDASDGTTVTEGTTAAPIEEIIEDSLNVSGAAEKIYYADAGEEILITVHIENPDDFEILSFTLNGKKYANNMFEPGSDLQNLILKVPVPEDAVGLYEYTIDAIKYVDGTAIKDVKMEGDKTVAIGVPGYPIGMTLKKEKIDLNSLYLEVELRDPDNIIAITGTAQVVLYQGEKVLGMQPLTANQTTLVRFDNLEPGTDYSYAFVIACDFFKGNGFEVKTHRQADFRTLDWITFDGVETDTTTFSFTPVWNTRTDEKEILGYTLYRGEEKLRELDADTVLIEDLTDGTEYTLVAELLVKGERKTASYTFQTKLTEYTVEYYLPTSEGYERATFRKEKAHAGVPIQVPIKYSNSSCFAPEVQTVTIAPDGSTVVKYYFTKTISADRLTFICEWGTLENLQSEYAVGDPLPTVVPKEGFTFTGWKQHFGDRFYPINGIRSDFTMYIAEFSGGGVLPDFSYKYEVWDGRLICTGMDPFNSQVGALGSSQVLYMNGHRDGTPVVGLYVKQWTNIYSVTEVVLPSQLEVIGSGTFSAASNNVFTRITVPASVKHIEAGAFQSAGKSNAPLELELVTFADPTNWFDAEGNPVDLSDPAANAALFSNGGNVELFHRAT